MGGGLGELVNGSESVVMLLVLSMLPLLVKSCCWATQNGKELIGDADIDFGKVDDRVGVPSSFGGAGRGDSTSR